MHRGHLDRHLSFHVNQGLQRRRRRNRIRDAAAAIPLAAAAAAATAVGLRLGQLLFQLLDQCAQFVKLGQQLSLHRTSRSRCLLGLKFDHRRVVGEPQGGIRVRMELGLRTNRAKEVRFGVDHGVLEVLAQKVGVAPGDGGTWLELALLGGLGHLHKELRHLRQRQVDLFALVLEFFGFRLVCVRALELVLDLTVWLWNLFVLRIEDVSGRLGAGEVAHIQASALLQIRIFVRGLLNLEGHDAMSAGGLVVELRGRNGLACVALLKHLAKVLPAVDGNLATPVDVHEPVSIFAHARLVLLLECGGGGEIAHGVHHVLEVLHGDLPV
mmetsp:Transcript_3769/g.9144  ORF Transcript_3769/g.9144 Transcript_3769/m.9144 type:complete len:326 (+) Transcript_3769:1850-2827(+)